ncbi:MAG: hypothetical protein L0271_06980 [Gemmatimonadetes bacterium]|nr:hypothetical protein [Gemmatimonadota bacterium]
MTPVGRISSRRLPESLRNRLEVATALAWEALAETHVAQALTFIQLLTERMLLEDSLPRYLLEMDLGDAMATAVRTRVLVTFENTVAGDESNPPIAIRPDVDTGVALPAGDDASPSWHRFRPDIAIGRLRKRVLQDEETERRIKLALARAEEAVIRTHVDNAITFAALLEAALPVDRAVQVYLESVGLSGGRAQAVYQRTMARLADVHLPLPKSGRG